MQKEKERDGIFAKNTDISNHRRAPDLALIVLPKDTHSVRPPLSSRTCAYPVFIHIPIMKKPTALVIRSPTAFTLLFCKSLVENEAEKAKSDDDLLSSFQPIRLLMHRLANNGDNAAYTSEHRPLRGRDI